MKAFVWDDLFVTGIDSVDQQHRHLVDVVNQLGDLLLVGAERPAQETDALFKDLADYAHYHFSDEERLMAEHKLDPRHVESHTRHHGEFVQQLLSMWRSRAAMNSPSEVLHGFLAAWLSFHILGEDQAMARQIAHIRAGMSPAQAYDAEAKPHDHSTAALLSALHQLYHVLSAQNADLAAVNAGLESKVEERTHALAEANASLQREQAELRRLLAKVEQAQSQLLQAEKMASIGQLAAGVAHEINNPVGFVNSNLGTLKTYVDDLVGLLETCRLGKATEADFAAADFEFMKSDIADLVRESQDGLDRVKKIVANLKDFSHVDEAEWQDADLNAGLESTLNVVWNELKYKVEVVRELAVLPPVACVPAQINQVVMNLLVNAAQAIETKGVITVRTGRDDRWAWIEIADTGKGMAPEVQTRIFEPFYTTKPVGKGTGLGLSLSYDIVKTHGGYIDVVSAPGQGSTFRVNLPLEGGPPAE